MSQNLDDLDYHALHKIWMNLQWYDSQEGLPPSGGFEILAVEKALNKAFEALSDEEKKELEESG